MIIDDDGGSFSSLEVVNGSAGVSYYDQVNDDLKFAFLMPNAARQWTGYE